MCGVGCVIEGEKKAGAAGEQRRTGGAKQNGR